MINCRSPIYIFTQKAVSCFLLYFNQIEPLKISLKTVSCLFPIETKIAWAKYLVEGVESCRLQLCSSLRLFGGRGPKADPHGR